MEKEMLEKRIEKKLKTMQESLKYQMDSLCEMMSDLHTIQYFTYLAKNEET